MGAQAAAHQSGGGCFRRFSHSQRTHRPLEVHGPNVQSGCIHHELPGRPGHHQPLQAEAGRQGQQQGGARVSLIHILRPDLSLTRRIENWTPVICVVVQVFKI